LDLGHVLSDGRVGVRDAEFDLKLKRNTVLSVFGMVTTDASDEGDVLPFD
jgi:hypothetical protein